MKPKTMILMGLAIVCGLGASYMTSRLLAERQPAEEEKIEILVAKKNLNVGERIINPEDYFERKAVVKADEPPDAIKEFETLKGKVMRQSRNRGDHITVANLLEKNRLDIPEGTQAVGLPVNLATTAHGLATLPGSRVDLMLTVRGKDPSSTISKIVVQNALVLAADGRVTPEGELIAPASVVTLALNDKDRLIATTAKEMGILTLSLRKLDESGLAEDIAITGDIVLNGKKKELPKVVDAPKPPPEPQPVFVPELKGTPGRLDIDQGNERRTIRFRVQENGEVEYDDVSPPRAAVQQPRPQPLPPQSQGQPANPFKTGSSREY